MNACIRAPAAVVVLVACHAVANRLAAEDAVSPGTEHAYGIERRIPWTTSHVHGTPDPPDPYRTEVIFPQLRFDQPLAAVAVPGHDRLAVVERYGKIFTFANDSAIDKAELLLDTKKTTYGIAFHPRFAENGYVYVTYIDEPAAPPPHGTRVSRFHVPAGTWTCDPASEQVVIEWLSGGHNGGCLRFGPDGYLYVATGDGSGIADELQTGQDLGDLLAALLRIDVDRAEDGKQYAIPADNPFVGMPGARPEVYAYGLRQVWKFSFDRATRKLWAGEVGQDLWETVLRIERGGNYGWSVQEGRHPFRPERTQGPTPILPSVAEHPHSDFRSITGGYVYRGTRLPELAGAYLYGDFDTGRLWSLRIAEGTAVETRELVDTPLRIVDFAEDQAGEVYLLDMMGGQFHRLVNAPASAPSAPFPTRLSETGLFASVRDHQPAAGVISYSVNAPLWSDNAYKERFLALPGLSQIEFDGVTYPQPAPGVPPGWRFPDGTVLVKTFSLEAETGNPSTRRRVETRLLHYEQLAGTEEFGDQYWEGYSYAWNADQTDAELVAARGMDREYSIADPREPSGIRQQTWHYPSRAECTLCHTMAAKYVLGVNTLQMNKHHDYGGVVANQLSTLDHLGIFTKPLPAPPEALPRLADYEDESISIEQRARSYLHANCSHCHRKWGGGNAEFHLMATTPLAETAAVNSKPGQGSFGLADPRIIAPGDPNRSLVLRRMQILGLGRMPHVASNVVDEDAVHLIREWLVGLKPEP